MLRRETIIALRARHQAFRIATEVAHPPLDVPPSPPPKLCEGMPPPPLSYAPSREWELEYCPPPPVPLEHDRDVADALRHFAIACGIIVGSLVLFLAMWAIVNIP